MSQFDHLDFDPCGLPIQTDQKFKRIRTFIKNISKKITFEAKINVSLVYAYIRPCTHSSLAETFLLEDYKVQPLSAGTIDQKRSLTTASCSVLQSQNSMHGSFGH